MPVHAGATANVLFTLHDYYPGAMEDHCAARWAEG